MKRAHNNIAIVILSATLLIIFVAGCSERDRPQKIDLTEKLAAATEDESGDVLFFGISSSESPQSIYRRYTPLADYLAEMMEREVRLVQRRTYKELNNLCRKGGVDFAWLTSGAYIDLSKDWDAEILALPSRNGKSYYEACIIVHRDSPIIRFDELRGKSFALIDPLSSAGYYYPAYLLSEKGLNPDKFFSRVVFSGGHDKSIRLILNKEVEGASVSSAVLRDLQKNESEIGQTIRVIQTSDPITMGPIVAQKEMHAELKGRLREVILNMHLDLPGKGVLEIIEIDRFIPGSDSGYRSVREMINAHPKT